MAQTLDFRGRWVLVTGASSGLGLEMARELARVDGANLILVARRRERLEALADELSKKYGTRTAVIAADLSNPADVERLANEALDGRELHGAILNAGVTYFGRALSIDDATLRSLVETNVTSTVRLTNRFVRHMLERRNGGGVMLVSSVGGVSPMPFQAAYGASKSFLNNYAQALAEEVRGGGVTVSVFVPGGIATEMADKIGATTSRALAAFLMPADRCARLALAGLRSRRVFHVPGPLYQATALLSRLAPPRLVARQTASIYRDTLPQE